MRGMRPGIVERNQAGECFKPEFLTVCEVQGRWQPRKPGKSENRKIFESGKVRESEIFEVKKREKCLRNGGEFGDKGIMSTPGNTGRNRESTTGNNQKNSENPHEKSRVFTISVSARRLQQMPLGRAQTTSLCLFPLFKSSEEKIVST